MHFSWRKKHKFDYLVLGGGGQQGQITSRDLLERGNKVFIADLYKDGAHENLKKFDKATFEYADVRSVEKTTKLIKKTKPKVVINCAEGDWNDKVYRAALKAKRSVVDLGSEIWMTKKQLAMNEDFRKKGLVAITGCGSTPGINNVMLKYASKFFDRLETVQAGFAWDSNIKKFVVPFSINSILWEFTEKAPFVQNGKWKTALPLDTVEDREFREIGTVKNFIVVHPETYSFYKTYQRKGLKNVKFFAGFPNHSFTLITDLMYLGLDNRNELRVDGQDVIPIDVLTQVLKKLEWPKGYTEKENLWVDAEGTFEGRPQKILMECIVDTLPQWKNAGCNIDTGIPASIMAQMIAEGKMKKFGSFVPEQIVPPVEFFDRLADYKMRVYCNGELINGAEQQAKSFNPKEKPNGSVVVGNGSLWKFAKTLFRS